MKESKKSIEKIEIMIKEHLVYEIQLFLFSANFLLIDKITEKLIYPLSIPYINEGILNKVALEHWVMAMRKLYEFLYEPKGDSDYFLAYDCFEKKQDWIDIIGEPDKELRKQIIRAHSMTAHISTTRLIDKKKYKGWNIEITEILVEKINVFLKSLSNIKLCIEFEKSINYNIAKNKEGFWVLFNQIG